MYQLSVKKKKSSKDTELSVPAGGMISSG